MLRAAISTYSYIWFFANVMKITCDHGGDLFIVCAGYANLQQAPI